MKIKLLSTAIVLSTVLFVNQTNAQETIVIEAYDKLKYSAFLKDEYSPIPIPYSVPFSEYVRTNVAYESMEMNFEDINPKDWYYEDAIYNNKMGFITGKDVSYMLKPQDKLTRAELVAIVQRWYTASQPVVVQNKFYDLDNTHWAYKNLLKGLGSGYLTGYEDGTLKPNNNVTRAEVASILERYIKDEMKYAITFDENQFKDVTFSDVPNNHWAKSSIKYVANVLGFYGYEDGTFKPNQEITRAEMTALNTRLVDLKALYLTNKPWK